MIGTELLFKKLNYCQLGMILAYEKNFKKERAIKHSNIRAYDLLNSIGQNILTSFNLEKMLEVLNENLSNLEIKGYFLYLLKRILILPRTADL